MTLNEYFDAIFCIHLAGRDDRLAHVRGQQQVHNLDVRIWKGVDGRAAMPNEPNAATQGNYGCTTSHQQLLQYIVAQNIPRALILEDDFEFVVPDANAAFASMIGEVPEDWEMLYLGAGYGEDPKRRVSPHVIECNAMMTTSSYAVTLEAAKKMVQHIYGAHPIDCLYHKWNRELKTYIFDPRLCVQYENLSSIQNRVMNNAMSMLDAGHISRLDGKR